ncbi:armadillo repeat-containing protein 4 armc4 [Anaeramoeba flamelloides]|uniref:Armadillo repeat-containing protein 4 armc4 n=1 Tax=Anaeramoeba flamelloides TaxID=1746091 RepID=A0ABQ8XXP7_9EUKA|nr:armadillo repeat-containing protein 4 armc4 [Anaeramoeba flamelloides]
MTTNTYTQIYSLTEQMKENSSSITLLIENFKVLNNLVLENSRTIHQVIRSERVVPFIISILAQNSSSIELLETGFGSLRNIAVDDQNCLLVCTSDIFQLVIQSLNEFTINSAFVRTAFGLLINLSRLSENRKAMKQYGISRCLVYVSRYYESNKAIQQQILNCLTAMTLSDDLSRELIEESVLIILKQICLNFASQDLEIINLALDIYQNFSTDDTIAIILGQENVIDWVLKILFSNENDYNIVLKSFSVLANLAVNLLNNLILFNKDIFSVIFSHLQPKNNYRHQFHKQQQQQQQQQLKYQFQQEYGMENQSTNNNEIKKKILILLNNLSREEQFLSQLQNNGYLNTFIQLTEQSLSNDQISFLFLNLLLNISSQEKYLPILVEKRVVSIAISSLSKENLIKSSLSILINMSINEKARNQVRILDGLPSLLQLLKSQTNNTQIILLILKLLTNLAFEQKNRKVISLNGGEYTIKQTSKLFPNNNQIQMEVKEVLQNLEAGF